MDPDVRESLLRAGRISREARERAVGLVGDGVLLLDVAEEVEDLMRKKGARPAFPTCISIDDIAAHYSPTHDDALRFRRGNVVKLDLGAQLDGWIDARAGDWLVTDGENQQRVLTDEAFRRRYEPATDEARRVLADAKLDRPF